MYSLGIDIGGTKCAVVLGKGELSENTESFIIDKIKFPTEVTRGWKAVLNEILEKGDELLLRNNIKNTDLIGVGISCGGPLNSTKGTINCPPNLPDWDNVPVVKIVSEHFGVRCVLHNDANACAVAEWRFGAGKGYNNLVFLTFGTGMGAGLILDGRLYCGTNDCAGEVGHIRLAEDGPVGYGKAGSFEGFCSGGGIADMAKKMLSIYNGITSIPKDKVTAQTIAEAAFNGDKLANAIYKKCGEKLGYALSILIDILNPEMIVIGSIFERSGELMKEAMYGVINKEALYISAEACRIVPAMLGDNIGDYAALGVAKMFAEEIK